MVQWMVNKSDSKSGGGKSGGGIFISGSTTSTHHATLTQTSRSAYLFCLQEQDTTTNI